MRRWQGTPYDRLGRHCWWLASLTQAELFGRLLPAADPTLIADIRDRARMLAGHPVRQEWISVPQPVDGAVVLMGKTSGAETHVGTFLAIGAGMIWHTDEGHGVVLDPPLELAAARRWRLNYIVPSKLTT
nr:glycoside hydrolase [Methylobacterium brachythecii]